MDCRRCVIRLGGKRERGGKDGGVHRYLHDYGGGAGGAGWGCESDTGEEAGLGRKAGQEGCEEQSKGITQERVMGLEWGGGTG